MRDLPGRLAVAFVRILAILPLGLARRMGKAIARINMLGTPKSLRITRINVDLCFPQATESQRRQLAHDSYLNLGALVAESGLSWIWHSDRVLATIKSIRNEEILQEAFARGHGVLAIAPHLGNWEVFGMYLADKYPTTALYEPPEYPALDKLMRQARCRNGASLVATDRKGVAQLLKALRSGGVCAILPDQVPRDPSSHTRAPFYGREAITMTLVTRLLQKTEATALFVAAFRVPGGFELVIEKAEQALYSNDISESVTALNKSVETLINHAPEQYAWEYKRFRTLPRSVNDPYRPLVVRKDG